MSKKGFVYSNDGSAQDKMRSVNAAWHYNWNSTIPANIRLPYIPMIWGLKTLSKTESLMTDINGYENVLLGFNEPDLEKQSNISVDVAIANWPKFIATGRRLGSPATAQNPTKDNSWLSQFMQKAKDNNYRVDFICVHWYSPPNPTSFLQFIDSIYSQYGLPIWVTEMCCADWNSTIYVPAKYTSQDTINFMNVVIPELNKRDFVEKFTWKTRRTSDINLGFAALFNDDGSLTQVGEAYAAL